MKVIIMGFVLAFSAPSFAISTEKLIRACNMAGAEKILYQASALRPCF